MHTRRQYTALQAAYDHLNKVLWDGKLPPCLITLQRKAKARGYFLGDGFTARSGEGTIDEIALNPDFFENRTDLEILSTLCHEQVHLWQHHFGKVPRRCYHDRQWAGEMQRVGLVPSDTGQPGGKMTGERMSHYVAENGPFARAAAEFLVNRTAIAWTSSFPAGARATARNASAASKTKFTCPECGQNAWAKPGANLACANHDEPVIMIPVPR